MLGNFRPTRQEKSPVSGNSSAQSSLRGRFSSTGGAKTPLATDYTQIGLIDNIAGAEETEGQDDIPQIAETNLVAPEQIHLGIETPSQKRTFRAGYNFRRWEDMIELLPFWRQALNPINITFSIAICAAVIVLLFAHFANLPPDVPLFYSQATSSFILVDKTILLGLPIIILVVQLGLLRLLRHVFNHDRRLSNVIATAQIFCNFTYFIAILELLSINLY